MRRTFALLMVAMLFVVGSSTAFATTTQKVTIRAVIAQAGWETFDEETGAGESGAVQFARADGRTTVSFFMSKGELVLCQGADTPDDPSDDFYGFVGTQTVGDGPATLSVGRTYSSAKASGTVSATAFTTNECTGDEGSATTRTIKVSIDLNGVSPVINEKLHSTIKIPRLLRSRTVARAVSRQAAGTITVGSRTFATDGVVGQLWLKASLTQQ